MLDYRVMVCDPRDSYEPDNPVENVERLHCMPDEAVQACTGNPRCDDRVCSWISTAAVNMEFMDEENL